MCCTIFDHAPRTQGLGHLNCYFNNNSNKPESKAKFELLTDSLPTGLFQFTTLTLLTNDGTCGQLAFDKTAIDNK